MAFHCELITYTKSAVLISINCCVCYHFVRCFFAKAHCADSSIVHLREGPCGLNGPNATLSPEEVAHISAVCTHCLKHVV